MQTIWMEQKDYIPLVVLRKVLGSHNPLSLAHPCALFIGEGESHGGSCLRIFYFHEDKHSRIVINDIVESFAFP